MSEGLDDLQKLPIGNFVTAASDAQMTLMLIHAHNRINPADATLGDSMNDLRSLFETALGRPFVGQQVSAMKHLVECLQEAGITFDPAHPQTKVQEIWDFLKSCNDPRALSETEEDLLPEIVLFFGALHKKAGHATYSEMMERSHKHLHKI